MERFIGAGQGDAGSESFGADSFGELPEALVRERRGHCDDTFKIDDEFIVPSKPVESLR